MMGYFSRHGLSRPRRAANWLSAAFNRVVGPRQSLVQAIETDGYCIVPKLLAPSECRAILDHETPRRPVRADGWPKARAASDPFYFRLAKDERFLGILNPLLGADIIVWGVDILDRTPGEVHPWHCDIESSDRNGGFISVWIGLANTSAKTGLHLISRSHRFGCTIQEEVHNRGMQRGQASGENVLAWARRRDPEARLAIPNLSDGDAVVFDGRLWHGSVNTAKSATRTAILLQYARADRTVRMFDPAHLGWPLRFRDGILPEVVIVAGEGGSPANLVVPPPTG
jgi:hypothetical protein